MWLLRHPHSPKAPGTRFSLQVHPTEIDLTRSSSVAKNGMSETCQFNVAVYHKWTRLNRHSIERAGETRGRPKAPPLNSAALASADQGVQFPNHVQDVQQIEASDLDKKRK